MAAAVASEGDRSLSLNSDLLNHIGAEIEGVPTEFVWVKFTNCLFLAVTQYKKVGSLAVIEKDDFVTSPEGSVASFDVNILLGSSDVETQLAARYLAENLNIDKTLYLFCNLKSYNVEQLKAVKDVFLDVLDL